VIKTVPSAIAVTNPLVDTVAILNAFDTQGFVVAAVPVAPNCKVFPTHI
jgi:hypothetical protein